MIEINEKYKKLKEYLSGLNTAVVAFSSGVDSAFLLKTAHDVLGDRVVAVTIRSDLFPQRELTEAKEFCEKENIKHIIININALETEGFKNNPKNRCYLCKKELFKKVIEIAKENGTENVIEGSNIDDNSDYRPGSQAITELGIKSPLKYAELTKAEIRELSKKLNLPTYNKPSFACLASRFVYGEEITEEKLKMVEKAEQLLFDTGFSQFRVRIHGTMARIEVLPDEFEKLIRNREEIVQKFKEYGFSYVSMDLTGYRTGSMNETIL